MASSKMWQKTYWRHRLRALPRWAVIAGAIFFGGVVCILAMYGAYHLAYSGKIFPNTFVGSVNVGGRTKEVAQAAIEQAATAFQQSILTLSINGEAATLTPAQMDLTYNASQSVDVAWNVGRGEGFLGNVQDQVRLLIAPKHVAPISRLDETSLKSFFDELSTQYDTPEQEPSVSLVDGEVEIRAGQAGERYDRTLAEQTIRQAVTDLKFPTESVTIPLVTVEPHVTLGQANALRPDIEAALRAPLKLTYDNGSFTVDKEQLATWIIITQPSFSPAIPATVHLKSGAVPVLTFDQDRIGAYMKTLSDEVAQDPVDARLTIENGKATVFQQSRQGWQLDQVKAVAAIVTALNNRVTHPNMEAAAVPLPVVVDSPSVSSATIERLGIKELIGRGETDFSGSPGNRVHNIKTGVEYLKGLLVKPGDEFSTVGALGAVDASTGYLPELVIKENHTIPEYGGGLCQVSTTLFRSVLDAGLPVTERRNHSYRVSYYERKVGPGLDATVYLPKPDFVFKNDTPGWVLIQGHIAGSHLIFELYGTKDGRESHLDGPHTLWTKTPPESQYTDDSSLAPGETKLVEHAHAGAKTTATYWVTRGGEEINRQKFVSIYKALPARYLRGPDAPVDATPADQNSGDQPVAADTQEQPSA